MKNDCKFIFGTIFATNCIFELNNFTNNIISHFTPYKIIIPGHYNASPI